MDESDVLLAMAEVAIALLGFAAIVSVFRQRAQWRPDGRFWAMVTAGVGTLVFSLVPLPFLFTALPQQTTWRFCAVMFSFYAFGYCLFLVASYRRDSRAGSAPNSAIVSTLLGGSSLAAIVLLLSALEFLGAPQFWPYLSGLIWFQILTAALFVRLLVVWLR